MTRDRSRERDRTIPCKGCDGRASTGSTSGLCWNCALECRSHSNGALIAPTRPPERVFCGQCDRAVRLNEAKNCRRPFCKASQAVAA